uniref:Uncharacterized protein n=1 Tax=Phaeomonas parva TaxID=124430 RepID=A0A7S1UFC0_9STRA|mmetsp:Transcript_45615/g.142804  ORF Transcript_45615/g.142804 Transcript_45615/m.142804 type:complete len:233 (+) Transcript_45615:130-828(+)
MLARARVRVRLRAAAPLRRLLSSKRGLRERLAAAQAAEQRAAEERVQNLMANASRPAAEVAAASSEPPGMTWQAMVGHPAFKWGAASWLLSAAVAAYLMNTKPADDELTVLHRNFEEVFARVKAEREASGGAPPADAELRLWEDRWRELYHREDFNLSPVRVSKLEGLAGWTWELSGEAAAADDESVVAGRQRLLDKDGRRRLEEGDALRRAVFGLVQMADDAVETVKQWRK